MDFQPLNDNCRGMAPDMPDGWKTDLGIERKAPQWRISKPNYKIEDEIDLIRKDENFDYRISDTITPFPKGINPFVKIDTTNNGGVYGKLNLGCDPSNSGIPEAFPVNPLNEMDVEYPITALTDLLPLSRAVRENVPVSTNKTIFDYTKQTGLPEERCIRKNVIANFAKPTATFKMDKELIIPQNVRTKDSVFVSETAKKTFANINMQTNQDVELRADTRISTTARIAAPNLGAIQIPNEEYKQKNGFETSAFANKTSSFSKKIDALFESRDKTQINTQASVSKSYSSKQNISDFKPSLKDRNSISVSTSARPQINFNSTYENFRQGEKLKNTIETYISPKKLLILSSLNKGQLLSLKDGIDISTTARQTVNFSGIQKEQTFRDRVEANVSTGARQTVNFSGIQKEQTFRDRVEANVSTGARQTVNFSGIQKEQTFRDRAEHQISANSRISMPFDISKRDESEIAKERETLNLNHRKTAVLSNQGGGNATFSQSVDVEKHISNKPEIDAKSRKTYFSKQIEVLNAEDKMKDGIVASCKPGTRVMDNGSLTKTMDIIRMKDSIEASARTSKTFIDTKQNQNSKVKTKKIELVGNVQTNKIASSMVYVDKIIKDAELKPTIESDNSYMPLPDFKTFDRPENLVNMGSKSFV